MKNGRSALRRMSLVAAGCIGGLTVGQAFAGGPPIAFDGFTVSNGTITADCPLTPDGVQAICTDGVSDNGMLQREIVVPGGNHQGAYLQFILTEPGVSGDASGDYFSAEHGSLYFSNEDFIRQHHRGGGITSRNVILESEFTDPGTEQRFVSEHTYNYGWPQDAPNPWIDSYQEISTVDYSADPLNPVETFSSSADMVFGAGSFDTYGSLVFKQTVGLGGADLQKFQFDKKAGFANPFAGSATLPGGSVDWDMFETVTAMWVGQSLNGDSPADSQAMGRTRYENRTDGTDVRYTSLTDAEAAGWSSPPFGAVDSIGSGLDTVSPTASVPAPAGPVATVAAGTASSDASTVPLPVPYDAWTVADGVITLDACPAGVSCGAPVIDDKGIYQRIVGVDGVEYIHTIVTDEDATGDPEAGDFTADGLAYKNESFVRRDQVEQGIAANLHIAEQDTGYQTVYPGQGGLANPLPSTGGRFTYNTALKTGWARGGARDPRVAVDQTVLVEDDNYLDTSSMYNSFSLKRGTTGADTSIDMLTSVGTDRGADGHQSPIMFASSIRGGAFQDTAHEITDPFLLPGVDGNIAWSGGDVIQVTWVGGDYVTTDLDGRSSVSSTSYTNLSTGERTASTFTDGNSDTASLDPGSWMDPPFGPAPEYSDPFALP